MSRIVYCDSCSEAVPPSKTDTAWLTTHSGAEHSVDLCRPCFIKVLKLARAAWIGELDDDELRL